MLTTLKYLNWALLLSFSLFFIGCAEGYTTCEIYCPCYDGKTSASNIARWDGSQWLPIGNGLNGKVERIVIDSVSDELYVFGEFTKAGGVPVNGQAKWSERNQTWSAIGTILPQSSAELFYPTCVATNGKVYICNSAGNKLYNVDGTFLDSNGISVWDGVQWKMLKKLFDPPYSVSSPTVLAIIGTTLYFIAQPYETSGSLSFKTNLYLFDINTNQIIDSLPKGIIQNSFDSQFRYDYILVTNEGVFFDSGDGIYLYNNKILKKLIGIETKQANHYSQLSGSSEYASVENSVAISSTQDRTTDIILSDIKADTTFTLSVKRSNLILQTFHTKISGHTLFVGGAFYLKDGGADVRNIGAYDLRQKKWYDLAGGVCGPVHAIAEMNGSMYVGGEFSTLGKK